MTVQINIRNVSRDDAAKLASLLRAIGWFADLKKLSDSEATQRVRLQLNEHLKSDHHTLLVAELDNNILGYVGIHLQPYLFLPGPEGFVSELFVLPEHRGSGIGSRLLDAAVAWAKERGCCRLHLINLRSRESYARKYYEKRGWSERPDAADFLLNFR